MRDSRVGVGSRKTFNGAAFAEDIEEEDHDFRATLKQTKQETRTLSRVLSLSKSTRTTQSVCAWNKTNSRLSAKKKKEKICW